MQTDKQIDLSYIRRVPEDEYLPLSGTFTAERIYLMAAVVCQPDDAWQQETYSGWTETSCLVPALWVPYCEDAFDVDEDEQMFLDQRCTRYAVWGRRFLETQIGMLSERQRAAFQNFFGIVPGQPHACFDLAASLIEQVKDSYDQPFLAPSEIKPWSQALLSCLILNANLRFNAAETPYIKLETYSDVSPRFVRI
jgi:hypothetical protein